MDEQSVYQIPKRKVAAHRGMLFSGGGFFFTWLIICLASTGLMGAFLFLSSFPSGPKLLRDIVKTVGYLPPLFLWFIVLNLFHIFALKNRMTGISLDRNGGPTLVDHFLNAKEVLTQAGPKTREQVPQQHAIKAIIVEGHRRLAHAALPATAMLILSFIVGAYTLFHVMHYEGLAGVYMAKGLYFLALLGLLFGGMLHSQSCLVVTLVPVFWFGIPYYLTYKYGFESITHGLFDGLLFVPLLLITLRILGQLRASGNERMLAISPTGLFLCLPSITGDVKAFEVDVAGLIDVREEIDGYMAYIPVERGRPVQFFFHSRAELERFAAVGPKEARGCLARMGSGGSFLRLLLCFICSSCVLAGTIVLAPLIVLEDKISEKAPLVMMRPGLTGEARQPMIVRSSFIPQMAMGRFHSSIVAFHDERFLDAESDLKSAVWWSGNRGRAGRLIKAATDGGYGVFCTRAAEVIAGVDQVNVPPGHDPIAFRHYELARGYAKAFADLAPQFPPGEHYYDLIVRHLRKAISLSEENVPPEVEWLMAQVLGMQLGRLNVALPHIDPIFLESWALESRRLRNSLEGKVEERELLRFDSRNLFRDELFADAITIMKRVGGARAKLMMASAARFTGTNLAFHLKRVRKIGKEKLSLAVEAKLLEALLLGQMGKPKESKKILMELGGDYAKGFEARFLNILVLNLAKLPTPRTEVLEPKMRKALRVPGMKVGDLPWPEWIARVDLEYLAGIRGARDKKILKRLSQATFYPFKARAKAHMKKAKKDKGLQRGDVTSHQYQGWILQNRK